MGELKRFESFLSVVDHSSFSNAAIKLGTSKAMVSRHVAELEDELHVRLFNRNTRKVELTDLGHNYAQDCRNILAEVALSKARLREQHVSIGGKLRIQAPPGLGNHHLSLLWGAFCMEYPDVQLEIDLFDAASANASSKDWDLSIQVGILADSRLIAQKLTKTEFVLCAAPTYLARAEEIVRPADIALHRVIIDTTDRQDLRWSLSDATQKTSWIDLEGLSAMRCNSSDTCMKQAINGYGLSYLPMYLVEQHLASGALLRVLPDFKGRVESISVLSHSRKHLSRTMRVMIDFLQRSFEDKNWV